MGSDEAAWAHRNFNRSALGDKRRRKRLVTIAEAMAKRPGRSIPGLFQSRCDVKAAYQLFSHPDSTPDNLQKSHRDQVRWQLDQPGTYLLIEDTSEMAWPKETATSGLGILSSRREKGFLLHSVLAVAWHGDAPSACDQKRAPLHILGLADQQFYIRQPIPAGERNDDSYSRHRRPLESRLWLDAGQRVGPVSEQGRLVRVCDRGADIYEFLKSCRQLGHDFVVRAAQDRVLHEAIDGDRKLFAAIRRQPSLGSFDLDLRRRGSMPARRATLHASSLAVQVRAPQRPGHGPGTLPPIACTIVRVWEPDPPADTAGLEWLLLVSQPITTFAEALECSRQYACRWLIEEYHKALKTGMGAEDLQLETAARLFAAIAVMAIAALRLIELKEAVRIDPGQPAEVSGLSNFEIRLLAAHLKRDIRTVGDVALAIGRLGGHMNRQGDGMPGLITLWRGWNELQAMILGARLALQLGTYG